MIIFFPMMQLLLLLLLMIIDGVLENLRGFFFQGVSSLHVERTAEVG